MAHDPQTPQGVLHVGGGAGATLPLAALPEPPFEPPLLDVPLLPMDEPLDEPLADPLVEPTADPLEPDESPVCDPVPSPEVSVDPPQAAAPNMALAPAPTTMRKRSRVG